MPGSAPLPQGGPLPFPFPSRITGLQKSLLPPLPQLAIVSLTPFPLLKKEGGIGGKLGAGWREVVPKVSLETVEGWPWVGGVRGTLHAWVPEGRYMGGKSFSLPEILMSSNLH